VEHLANTRYQICGLEQNPPATSITLKWQAAMRSVTFVVRVGKGCPTATYCGPSSQAFQ
jgi:hypothetical protein